MTRSLPAALRGRDGLVHCLVDAVPANGPGTAVLLAGLTRALVATALAEARRGTPPAAAPAGQVAAALAAAARHGLAGAGVDPFTGQAVDARALRARLLDHIYPALTEHGDTETITGLLHRLDQQGTGADRQRALFTSAASPPAFITALAARRCPATSPRRWRRADARVPAAAGAPWFRLRSGRRTLRDLEQDMTMPARGRWHQPAAAARNAPCTP